jgi:hypothetical protein
MGPSPARDEEMLSVSEPAQFWQFPRSWTSAFRSNHFSAVFQVNCKSFDLQQYSHAELRELTKRFKTPQRSYKPAR